MCDNGVAGLRERMGSLSLAYQKERPNVETSDLTVLVIRALGLIVGRMIRGEGVKSDEGDTGDTRSSSDTRYKKWFIQTSLITGAAQQIAEVHEVDMSPDRITGARVGRVLNKMRLSRDRQEGGGKRGWSISLEEVIRWATSYGLDPGKITGIRTMPMQSSSHEMSVTAGSSVTRDTLQGQQPFQWQGVL